MDEAKQISWIFIYTDTIIQYMYTMNGCAWLHWNVPYIYTGDLLNILRGSNITYVFCKMCEEKKEKKKQTNRMENGSFYERNERVVLYEVPCVW